MKAAAGDAAAGVPEGFRALRLEVNPYLELVGPLHGRVDGERFVVGLHVQPRHCSRSGMLHGGMLMTLADMVLILSTNHQTRIHRFMSTVSMNIDFLSPAPCGSWIEGHTEVLRVTRNLVFSQALFMVRGQTAARVSGILKPFGDPDHSLSAAYYLG